MHSGLPPGQAGASAPRSSAGLGHRSATSLAWTAWMTTARTAGGRGEEDDRPERGGRARRTLARPTRSGQPWMEDRR